MNICEHFMKKLVVFCLLVGVVLLAGAPPVAAQNVIPDPHLRAAINEVLGPNPGQLVRLWDTAVTEAEIKTLTWLRKTRAWPRMPIIDLTGLEKATNLISLDLRSSSISGISAVSGLTKLTSLDLGSNSISDISHLSGLTKLTSLELDYNSISDIATYRRGVAALERILESLIIPEESALLPNYPNPFNPETWIPYQLASPAAVTLTLYDVTGRVVRTLHLGHQHAGMYRSKSRAAYWDGRNAQGEPVASGVYFYTLVAGEFTATGKMLIRK